MFTNDKTQKKLDEITALQREGSRLCGAGNVAQGLEMINNASQLLRALDPEYYAALDARDTEYHEKMQQIFAKMDALPMSDKAQFVACIKEAHQLIDWYTKE